MELSLKKRLGAFAAAGALALAMAPAAAFGVGALTADTTLTVSGLDNGDEVSFYRILEQDSSTNEWKFVDVLDTNKDGKLDGATDITVESLRAFANKPDYNDSKVITGEMANKIAAQVAAKITTASASGTAADGKVEVNLRKDLDDEDPTPVGLYMAVVTKPAKTDIVYKPIFISADFDQGAAKGTVAAHDNTNSIAITETVGETKGTGYQDDPTNGVFKKSKLTLDKVAGDKNDRQMDLGVGDVADFTITTNMPSYTQNFETPVFKITDELTEGLVLSKADGSAAVAADITVAVEGYTLTANDYKVTINNEKKFTVEFMNDNEAVDGEKDGILYKVLGNPKVTITYKAKVTNTNAANQVNQTDNNVTLNFTNNPKDKTGAGELKDRTRHYTFGIDANITGTKPGPDGKTTTSELRKIAVDANGEVIYEKKTTELEDSIEKENPDVYKWLQGAKFELKQTKVWKDADAASGDDTYGINGDFEELATPKEIKFDANKIAGGDNVPESDANGYIAMKGLDAGVYELKETSAPLGYSFDPSIVYEITITPYFANDKETDSKYTSVPNKILEKYTVGIKAKKGTEQLAETLTTYTSDTAGTPATPVSFIAEGENSKGGISVTEEDTATAETALIVNKELGILPATGGSGILFYVGIGAAIMALAIVLSRRGRKVNGTVSGATA